MEVKSVKREVLVTDKENDILRGGESVSVHGFVAYLSWTEKGALIFVPGTSIKGVFEDKLKGGN